MQDGPLFRIELNYKTRLVSDNRLRYLPVGGLHFVPATTTFGGRTHFFGDEQMHVLCQYESTVSQLSPPA